MKVKKDSFVSAYLFSIVISIICFYILYFLVFRITLQTPDNHLPVYNFFGIFYKDLFVSSVITQIIGAVCTVLFFTFGREQKRFVPNIIIGLILSLIGGWFCSLLGSYVNSLPNINSVIQIIIQLVVLSSNMFIIYFINKKGEEINNEV